MDTNEYDYKDFICLTEYQCFELIAEAPKEAESAYVLIGAGEDESVWGDDFFFGKTEE